MFPFRRAGALIAATTTTAVVLAGVPFAGAAEADQVKIRVANITDFHGRLAENISKDKATGALTPKPKDEMGAAYIAGIIDYIRSQNENTIVTTSGDNQGGSAFISAATGDEYTMKFVNAIGTNGSAVGNHEFDKGYKDLIDRIVPGTNNKQLGANIFVDGKQPVKAYEIVEIDGVKVALVGTTSNLTKSKSNPENVQGVEFTDSAEQVNKEAEALKKEGKADVVIALIHDPAKEASAKLKPEFVDFVFGGDTHERTLDTKANVPYAQSHEYGKVVTDLDFTYDKETGKIVGLDAKQYDATHLKELGVKPNADVAKIVDEARTAADKEGTKVVATVSDSFMRGSNLGGDPGSNRGTESTANNMIAQSALIALENFLGTELDFGIMNAGGVRADLAKGEVTYKQAFDVQPFGNDISVAKVKGSTLKEMLENQWKSAKDDRPRLDIGLSDNVAYTYNPDAPQGERILNITIDGKDVDLDKEYSFAASSFLLSGGDAFIDPYKVIDRNDVGYNDLQAFIDYLTTGEAKVRSGQKDVGVVLPEGGLKAGEKNTIKLSSLSYSTEGEPKAETVTVKIGETTTEAKVNNEITDADKGYGEQGRATIEIDLPAELSGEQALTITTDKGTNVSMPVKVTAADKPVEKPADKNDPKENEVPTPGEKTDDKDAGSSVDGNIGIIIGAVAGVLALMALLFAFPIDSFLGPIAKF